MSKVKMINTGKLFRENFPFNKSLLRAMKKIEEDRKNPPRRIRPLSKRTLEAMKEIIAADRELDKLEQYIERYRKAS